MTGATPKVSESFRDGYHRSPGQSPERSVPVGQTPGRSLGLQFAIGREGLSERGSTRAGRELPIACGWRGPEGGEFEIGASPTDFPAPALRPGMAAITVLGASLGAVCHAKRCLEVLRTLKGAPAEARFLMGLAEAARPPLEAACALGARHGALPLLRPALALLKQVLAEAVQVLEEGAGDEDEEEGDGGARARPGSASGSVAAAGSTRGGERRPWLLGLRGDDGGVGREGGEGGGGVEAASSREAWHRWLGQKRGGLSRSEHCQEVCQRLAQAQQALQLALAALAAVQPGMVSVGAPFKFLPSAMEAARGMVHDFEMGRCESRGVCNGELHVQRRATSAGGGQRWEALGDCIGWLESEGSHGLRLSFQVLKELWEEENEGDAEQGEQDAKAGETHTVTLDSSVQFQRSTRGDVRGLESSPDEEGRLVYLITQDYDRYLLEFQLLDTSAEEFEMAVAMGILKNGRRSVDTALDIRPQKARAQLERIFGPFEPTAPQRQSSHGNSAAEFLSPLRQFKSLQV